MENYIILLIIVIVFILAQAMISVIAIALITGQEPVSFKTLDAYLSNWLRNDWKDKLYTIYVFVTRPIRIYQSFKLANMKAKSYCVGSEYISIQNLEYGHKPVYDFGRHKRKMEQRIQTVKNSDLGDFIPKAFLNELLPSKDPMKVYSDSKKKIVIEGNGRLFALRHSKVRYFVVECEVYVPQD